MPAQYHSQHIRCHDAKSNLENFSKADDIFVSFSSHLAIKQGSDHPFVARSYSFRDIDRGQRIGKAAGEADEENSRVEKMCNQIFLWSPNHQNLIASIIIYLISDCTSLHQGKEAQGVIDVRLRR